MKPRLKLYPVSNNSKQLDWSFVAYSKTRPMPFVRIGLLKLSLDLEECLLASNVRQNAHSRSHLSFDTNKRDIQQDQSPLSNRLKLFLRTPCSQTTSQCHIRSTFSTNFFTLVYSSDAHNDSIAQKSLMQTLQFRPNSKNRSKRYGLF